MNSPSRLFVSAAAALTLLAPLPVRAQVVATTFGPGDSYVLNSGYAVDRSQSIAEQFVYGGPAGFALARIRLAIFPDDDNQGNIFDYTISFRHGTNMNSAMILESWTFSAPVPRIYPLLSVAMPLLTVGDTYWIAAQSFVGFGAWNMNDQKQLGFASTSSIDGPWSSDGNALRLSAAYDVSVAAPGGGEPSPVPEPASVILTATGLLGVALVAGRRHRVAEVSLHEVGDPVQRKRMPAVVIAVSVMITGANCAHVRPPATELWNHLVTMASPHLYVAPIRIRS